jgi:predicted secreted protein
MSNKGAGVFSLIAGACFIAIWWVYLFGVKPDCLSSIEAAKRALLFAISPAEAGWLLIYTLISIIVCFLCSVLFLSENQAKVAFVLTFLHGVVGFFLYTWALVILIFLPLTFATKTEGRKNE